MFKSPNITEDVTLHISKLKIAISKRQLEVIKYLLPKIDVNIKIMQGLTILHVAVLNALPKEILGIIVKRFKDNNLSLDIVDPYGKTPLDTAFLKGNIEAIKILIEAGADYQRYFSESLKMTYLSIFLEKNPKFFNEISSFIGQKENKEKATCWNFSMNSFLNQFKGYRQIESSNTSLFSKQEPLDVSNKPILLKKKD